MKKYEYKTLEILNKPGFLTGIKKQSLPDFTDIFNKEGRDGWLLVQILPPDFAMSMLTGNSGSFFAVLQREIVE